MHVIVVGTPHLSFTFYLIIEYLLHRNSVFCKLFSKLCYYVQTYEDWSLFVKESITGILCRAHQSSKSNEYDFQLS